MKRYFAPFGADISSFFLSFLVENEV